ncbi:proline racemase family protein [Halogeometricum sp. S1BR25-6]|uniref:Proline racemase family protein n=1 Tax=Halogeometricum salsisoli TaxID=2950536 RepID=A0ABU2GJG5_9EURY|nr:proline racemase family protein [Halogeometricum sp. S1BR25-6]MDS0300561.1 proline racemase family protein [Halogeometricum sp. S1BR25-6]
MESDPFAECVDTHTAGEPTRILTGGFDASELDRRSAEASRDSFAERYDWLRRLLVREPRGHEHMFGAIPVFEVDDAADFGLFFFDNGGYLDMCGHGTIGVVTALIETGRLPERSSYEIATPAGTVTAEPTVEDGRVRSVEIDNIPSYMTGGTRVDLPGTGPVDVDLVYSGNVVALVDAAQFDFALEESNLDRIRECGRTLKRRLNANDAAPTDDSLPAPVSVVEFYERRSDVDRNVVVFGNGSIDRSPCGTGTCAKMTLLYEEGELAVGTPYRYQSVLGREFVGTVRDVEDGEDGAVVHPVVRGSAYVTGTHQFVRDPEDDLGSFHLGSG